MKMLTDSREQLPLSFPYKYVSSTEVKKLDVGDYSCMFEDGYEVPVYFDRKSIADMVGTFTNSKKVKNFDRFKREIQRAKDANVKLILIIEGSFSKVLKGTKYSKRKGVSIVKQAFTLFFKYGVPTIYCTNREEMARYIYEYYCKIGELRSKGIEVTL